VNCGNRVVLLQQTMMCLIGVAAAWPMGELAGNTLSGNDPFVT